MHVGYLIFMHNFVFGKCTKQKKQVYIEIIFYFKTIKIVQSMVILRESNAEEQICKLVK